MDNLSKEEQLALSQAQKLQELCQTPGYQEVFLPWLKDKINHSWLDPRKADNDKDFIRKYNIAWAFAQSCEGILQFFDEAESTFKTLSKKRDGETVDKLRESVS